MFHDFKFTHYFVSVSSLLGINAVELRDALTTNSNVTRGMGNKNYKIILFMSIVMIVDLYLMQIFFFKGKTRNWLNAILFAMNRVFISFNSRGNHSTEQLCRSSDRWP